MAKQNFIPKGKASKKDQERSLKNNISSERKKASKERIKTMTDGILEGLGLGMEKMEKAKAGDPTILEVHEALANVSYAYNKRFLEEQWANIEIVKEK